jgi:Chaperone of endosialidase
MSFSTATGISLIDSRNKSATLLLPSVTDIPGRILYVKDSAYAFGSSSITLSTQINQSFDNGKGLKTLQETDGYVLLASDGISKWRQIGGSAVNESYIQNSRISSLFANTISTTYITTTKNLSRSTFELNTKFNVGPSTLLYRGNDLFTPLQMNMKLYDLPISTLTDMTTWRVNILSTFTMNSEFNIPIDFGAYPNNKKYYSTFMNNIPLDIASRSMNIKMWGVGGNSGFIGNTAPPSANLRGGAGAFMNVQGFYPSRVFGTYYDNISYSLYVPNADTTYLGAEPFVVSSISGTFNDITTYSGRGAIYGPVIRIFYQGSNYDILSPASGGGSYWRSNATTGQSNQKNGGDATSAVASNITNVLWDPNIYNASNGYGIGGGGAIIGQSSNNNAGGAGTSLNNLGVYCYPYNTTNYQNGNISVGSAIASQSDPDWIEAGGLNQGYGLGGAGNSVLGSGLGGSPLVVIDQPYDRLTSNLTFVGNGSFTGLITAPVTFRLSGPDGLYLAINGKPIINNWTVSNQMYSISTIMQINQGNNYAVNIMAFNATSSNNNLKFEYYIENPQTVGDEVVLSVSSGIFLNNASTTFTSSVVANSIFTNTFQTQNFIGQTFQLVPSNIQATTPFYVASPATFADTLNVKQHLSVSYTVRTSSVVTSSLVLHNTFSGSDKQEILLYDSTLTIGKMQLMTQLNVNSLVLGSTLAGLGSYGYLSTMTLGSSNFNSTVAGLGSSGYLSSLNTVGTWNFVSTSGLTSTVQGLGTVGYVSTALGLDFILQSTVRGLGTVGLISTSGLTSTVRGLGTIGYMSSAVGIDVILQSTNRGLGTFGYASSFVTLGQLGYISSSGLTSSINGLGTMGFLSSFVTQSSLSSGLTNISMNVSNIFFNVGAREVVRFVSTGSVGIGVSSPFTKLDVDGSLFIRSSLYVSSAIIINKGVNVNANAVLDVSGTVTMGSLFVQGQGTFGTTVTAQSFATPSDKTLKKDIQTIVGAMNLIQKSRGVSFKWLSTGVQDYGYIAQEVETFLPQAILKQESTLYVKYDVFVPFITEGLKSLQSEISDIRAILVKNGIF